MAKLQVKAAKMNMSEQANEGMIDRERDKVKFLLYVVHGNYGKDIRDGAREALYEMGVTKETLQSYDQHSSYVNEDLEINEYEKPYGYPDKNEKRSPSIYLLSLVPVLTILFLLAFIFGWIVIGVDVNVETNKPAVIEEAFDKGEEGESL